MSNDQKIALVTGAARRIGQTLALALAQRGWDILVHYASSTQEAWQTLEAIRQLGRRAESLCADLSDETQVRNIIPRCVALMGVPRCVINNASLFEYDQASDFSYALLDVHMRINLAAPIVLARDVHQALLAHGMTQDSPGVVVNLLDQKLFNYNPDFLSYTLSKAGLQAATTLLAQALAPHMRVVGVAPGITLISGAQSQENFEHAHAQTPLRRSSTLEDIAQAVCFAVENRALTGTTLIVDGGQHLQASSRDVQF